MARARFHPASRLVGSLLTFALGACGPAAREATNVDAGDGAAHDVTPPDGGDASTSDAATSGCAGAALCESFETTALGAIPSGFVVGTPNCSGTGAVAVVDTQAHGGSRALAVEGASGYCNHVFLASTAPSTLSGTIYGRFHVRFGSALGAGHTTFFALADAVDHKDLRMGGQSGILMWNRELDDATLPALSPAGISLSIAPSASTWHCVTFAIDGASGRLSTGYDGATVAGLVIDGTPTADVDQQWLQGTAWRPQLTDIRFGWESYGGQAMALWFDDIALSTSPLSCE